MKIEPFDQSFVGIIVSRPSWQPGSSFLIEYVGATLLHGSAWVPMDGRSASDATAYLTETGRDGRFRYVDDWIVLAKKKSLVKLKMILGGRN